MASTFSHQAAVATTPSRLMQVMAALLAVILGAAFAIAQDETAVDVGPSIGAAIPESFVAPDHTGAERTLADLSGEEGLTLFFVRSVSWCPICRRQMSTVKDRQAELLAAGYNIAVISTDSTETLAELHDKRAYGFPTLADPDSELIRAWGLVDPQFETGRRAGLPYPATFLIGSDGVVKDKLMKFETYGNNRAYWRRVSFDEVVAAAEAARDAS